MSLQEQIFNHLGSPVLTKGMTLSASGVSAPPLQVIGVTTGLSSADGSFQDLLGKGQFDYDSAGYLYACDTTNNRIQRFSKNASGAWVFDSKCSSLSALGSSVNMEMVAIDRGRNQIHLGSSAQIAAGNLFGVWDLSLWPNLTTGNRTRSYGTSSASNGAGNLRAPLCLTVVGDIAFVCSSSGDYRAIKYDHTTGAILAQRTTSLWMARYVSDGAKVYSGAQASNTELGLWRMNAGTLAGTTRLDTGLPSGVNYTRRNYLVQGTGGDISDLIYHNGRVYVRLLRDGRILAWETSGDTFLDECLWPGGLGSVNAGHAPGSMFSPQIQQAKIGVAIGDNSKSDDFLAWSGNASNNSQQSFVSVYPMSVATATWTKSDWSAGPNTIKALLPVGANLSGEKYKIRLRKNAGSWITFNSDTLTSAAFFASLGVFTTGDVLTVEGNLSTWDRLDFNGLMQTRDKIPVTDFGVHVFWDDPSDAIIVHQQTSSLQGALAGGGLRGRLAA